MAKVRRRIYGRTLNEFVFMVHFSEVDHLLHIAGRQRRPASAEIVHRAAVVFLVAVWQQYVIAVAKDAFNKLLENAESPSVFGAKVLAVAGKTLRESRDERAIWKLAQTGWKDVLNEHRDSLLESFQSPSAAQTDKLFENLLGFKGVSQSWKWREMNAARASKKLDELLALRNKIAHRARTPGHVLARTDMVAYAAFVHRLAACLHNTTVVHMKQRVGKQRWMKMKFRGRFGELS